MIRPILVALLVAGPLVACGGDDAADPVTTTFVSATEPTATAVTATGETQTSGTSVDAQVVPLDAAPCSLLTADDVTAATGLTAAAGVEDGPISCSFELTGAGASIFVVVDDGEGRVAGAASLHDSYLSEGGEVVAGIGESAVHSSAFRAIAVDAGGGRFHAVGVNGGYPPELADPREPLIELATLALVRV